jgi:hypothetical protein
VLLCPIVGVRSQIAFAGVVWIASTVTFATSPPAHRTVRYSARLKVSSPSQIADRLRMPFGEGVAHPPRAPTCVELIAKCHPGDLEACAGLNAPARDTQALKATLANCLVLDVLGKGQPATTSRLEGLKWNRRVLPSLPPLAIAVSDESVQQAARAAEQGQSWHDLDKTISAVTDSDDQITVSGDGFIQVLICGDGATSTATGRRICLSSRSTH